MFLSFNARFKELQQKLTEVGFIFPIDGYILVYLNVLQQAFPVWADRQRYNMGQQSVYTEFTLKNMMDDLTDEARSQTEVSGSGNSKIAFYGNKFSEKGSRFQKQKKHANQNSGWPTQQGPSETYLNEKLCDHCNRSGQIEDKCWILHPKLRPERTFKKSLKDGKKDNEQHVMQNIAILPPRTPLKTSE